MLVLLFLSPLASSISTQRKHLWYFNGAEDRIIWDVNHSSGQRNTFVSTPSSTNLEVDLSFEASWNVFNGLLPGCLEKSSMSSLGGFLLLPIFINGQRRDPSFAIKAQGQRYIVYVHCTWAHCTTSLAYQVQLERQKWPKRTNRDLLTPLQPLLFGLVIHLWNHMAADFDWAITALTILATITEQYARVLII